LVEEVFPLSQRLLHYLAHQSFDVDRIWWMLFHKYIMDIKLEIYIFIIDEWKSLCKLNSRFSTWEQYCYDFWGILTLHVHQTEVIFTY
jgi:hypothetical protein